MANPNRRGGAATAAAAETAAGAEMNDETGEVGNGEADRILAMVARTPEDSALATDDADLPVLSWEDTVEVKGGNLTDAGFAQLQVGFEFRGYIMGEKLVPSEFGTEMPIPDGKGGFVIDQATKAPMMRKMQKVYTLKGTARTPIKGSDTFGTVQGRMTIPVYARMIEPVAENMAKEAELTAKARTKSASAPAVKIPLVIKYIGQAPDKASKIEGQRGRSGAHLFEIKRLRVVEVGA